MGKDQGPAAAGTKTTRRETPETPLSDAECHAVDAPWRDLPEYYGSWSTVYSRFRRWQIAGIGDRILEHLSIEPDYESIMIDATIVRVHQNGAGFSRQLADHEEA
jgi:transposase